MIAVLLGAALLSQTATPQVPIVEVESRVPGKATVWLAGSSPSAMAGWFYDGGGSRRYDQSPNCAPSKVAIKPEMTAFGVVKVTGEVQIWDIDAFAAHKPTGDVAAKFVQRAKERSFRGPVAELEAPMGALIGVFMPDPNFHRPSEQSSWQVNKAATGLKEVPVKLFQPFYIGDGRLPDGTPVRFNVPKGAANLYLGTMAESGWARNEGEFNVTLRFETARRPIR